VAHHRVDNSFCTRFLLYLPYPLKDAPPIRPSWCQRLGLDEAVDGRARFLGFFVWSSGSISV
jgi:hypothetical protein